MTKNLDALLAERPVDRERVDALQQRLFDEMRAHRLRELREASELTQVELASRLHVSQNWVPLIGRGDIERAKLDTLRPDVEAVGGHFRVDVELGDERIRFRLLAAKCCGASAG